ncbi:hypothetical protein [Allocoleopsis sp.]|uniref:hypothetical protein n=1 Tax=Allocoleopsis sp. TaxID=3088169 RepID=UPI002FD20C6A
MLLTLQGLFVSTSLRDAIASFVFPVLALSATDLFPNPCPKEAVLGAMYFAHHT